MAYQQELEAYCTDAIWSTPRLSCATYTKITNPRTQIGVWLRRVNGIIYIGIKELAFANSFMPLQSLNRPLLIDPAQREVYAKDTAQ